MTYLYGKRLKKYLLKMVNDMEYVNLMGSTHEYCPKCEANLNLQKGYHNNLPFWNCKGCGEMLINPQVEAEDDIVWICDGCGEMLNIQDGFSLERTEWTCQQCNFINKIDVSEVYFSEEEYQASLSEPYKGMSDDAVLELSLYQEVANISAKTNVYLVKSLEDDRLYVKKILRDYDISVYQYLQAYPVRFMPQIIQAYEGSNCLVVIEEYIAGRTLDAVLSEGCLSQKEAVRIITSVCRILRELQERERALIHRDIKPSNIMQGEDGNIYLLDMNVAKWYKAEEVEDTRLFGTLYYAAPEQLGYGFSASTEKSDVYALGILLNVMITGEYPKKKKASGDIWKIIERCISLEAEKRFSVTELVACLERM